MAIQIHYTYDTNVNFVILRIKISQIKLKLYIQNNFYCVITKYIIIKIEY